MENHFALESSLCLVAGRLSPDISFLNTTIFNVASSCQDATRKAIALIANDFTYRELGKKEIQSHFNGFFGQLNEQHPFNYQIAFGLTEPIITKGMAFYIDPSTQGELGKKRLATFLEALLQSHPKNQGLLDSFLELSSHSHKVEAEFPISGKRADLFIHWKDVKGIKFGVIVEVKFSHHVTDGQLLPYEEILHQYVKNTDHAALILLTRYGGAAPKNNKNWQSKAWLSVMANWERNLTHDNDIGFTLLRYFIWSKQRNK